MTTRAPSPAADLDVFYPIVPDAEWIARIVPLGVRTVQLRIKDANPSAIRHDIGEALDICRTHNCLLIVNDHWREALDLNVEFVHLGQEDLKAANLGDIKSAGVKLGISTHDTTELDIALNAQPDYIALGPIYETKLKVMAWAPQGLEKINLWKQKIGNIPLIGIGGITPRRAPGVIGAGANSVAVITDFLTHAEPVSRVKTWLEWAETERKA